MKKSMLLTTIAMIVVVVIALSTATFAWFSAAGQSAVEGTMTVQAGKEFTIKVSDGQTNPQWVDAGDTVNIAEGLKGIAPISPTIQINNEAKTYSTEVTSTSTVPKVVTQDGGEWYSVLGTSGGYKELTNVTAQTTKTYAYTALQVNRNDGGQEAYLQVAISVPDAAGNLQALQGARVLMAITSFDMTTGNKSKTEWFGTQYTYGGNGFLTADNKLIDPATSENWKTATGEGTPATGLTPLVKNGTYATLGGAVTDFATGAKNYKKADIFKSNKDFTGNDTATMFRFLEQKLDFSDPTEPKTIQIWVWMDGHKVDDASSKKNISINVSFAKTSIEATA